MSKHTPGPWFVGETLSDRGPCIVGDGDSVVCEFSGRAGASLEADARLIAAAPELLEALRAMRIVMDSGDKPAKLDAALSWRACDEKARAMCDAAIAKATGAA